jgi:hypothetical protein
MTNETVTTWNGSDWLATKVFSDLTGDTLAIISTESNHIEGKSYKP